MMARDKFMCRRDALEMDRTFPDPFYAEYDEEHGAWYVFGVQSGFAYTERPSKEEAEAEASRRNKTLRESKGVTA